MSTTMNEALIRDVVNEVVSRLQANGFAKPGPALAAPRAGGVDGIFQSVDAAVAAAKTAHQRLVASTLEVRGKAIQCIRDIVTQQA